MLSVIFVSLGLINLIVGNNILIRRLSGHEGEYEGERIRIAINNAPFNGYNDCKSVYESQENDGYTFDKEWGFYDLVYYCIFSLDCDDCRTDKDWKSEENRLVFYDSIKDKSVSQDATYSYLGFGGIKGSKDLQKMYGLQKNMDGNQFTLDFVRVSNGDIITSVTYTILQPKSQVLRIVILDNKPTNYKNCDESSNILDGSPLSMGLFEGDVKYVCAIFHWSLIGGSSHIEIGYLDDNSDYINMNIDSENPRDGLTSIRRFDYDYLELSYDNVLANYGNTFEVRAIMSNNDRDDNELASDEASLQFEAFVAME